jgi:hypothetical protein
MRGLPAAAARIEPHMLAIANPTSAPATAAAGLDVQPLQQAYVHATVLGRKLKVRRKRNSWFDCASCGNTPCYSLHAYGTDCLCPRDSLIMRWH